jgi:glycosyltransferase involved in cell wall biosynthesis
MKILVFQQAPDLGGSEFYMTDLISQWVSSGNQVKVYTNLKEYKMLLKKNGALIENLPLILDIVGDKRGFIKSLLLLFPAVIWYLYKLRIEKESTDVILMSGYTEKLLVSALTRLIKIPVVWLEYPPVELILKRNLTIPKMLYRYLSTIPKTIVAISENTKRSLIEETGLRKEKIQLIYPGTKNISLAKEEKERQSGKRIKRQLRIKDGIIIGNISRIAKEKGQDRLLKVFKTIHNKYPKAHLVLVGRGPDSQRLKSIANKLKLEDNVHFLGFVKDKYSILAIIDIFVFTSTWELEGFGISLIEAMIYGKPVIAFNSGPTKEIIVSNKSGVLVEPGNNNQLTKAILDLIKNEDKRELLSMRAKKEAENRFTIEKSAKNILRVLAYAKA